MTGGFKMNDIFSDIEKQVENIDAKIEDIVKNVTDSKNYEKLNQQINEMVNDSATAFEKGYEKAEKVVEAQSKKLKTSSDLQQENIKKYAKEIKQTSTKQVSTQQFSPQQVRNTDLFAQKGGTQVGGIVLAIVGFIFAGMLSIPILAILFLGQFWSTVNQVFLIPFVIFFLVGILGVRMATRVGRFKKYIAVLDEKMQSEVSALATSINKSMTFVRRDLKKMIANNWFKEGQLTSDGNVLVASKFAYEAYQIDQQHLLATQQRLDTIAQMPAQAQTVIQRGEDLIKEIHVNKVAISEYEMTIKLSHLESILKKILKRIEEQPQLVSQMRRMMDYYLPTTIKLLEAYVQLDKQAVQGTNILSAKTEIEESLDTLISAYEKLLDDLFKDTMLDVSTDIAVLNTMLAQDGLANDGFGNDNGGVN